MRPIATRGRRTQDGQPRYAGEAADTVHGGVRVGTRTARSADVGQWAREGREKDEQGARHCRGASTHGERVSMYMYWTAEFLGTSCRTRQGVTSVHTRRLGAL